MSVDGERVPTHYKSGYIHWNLVLDTSMGYFEGNITKYVSRWRKKNGLQDLEKALHYLDKMLERDAVRIPPGALALSQIALFSKANELTQVEQALIEDIVLWSTRDDLSRARLRLVALMTPDPVPLTEENHHSGRFGCDDDEVGW